MPLQETSGTASYDGFGGGAPAIPNYIEDVFSTWLYTGNGSTQTITNGIDLSGQGGLVWAKDRAFSGNHTLYDTARGATNRLFTNLTDAQSTLAQGLTAFTSSGFTLGTDGALNFNGEPFVSWTFRKQPKFFDVVTYTGNGANRTISHNLGSVPGCIIVKRTDTTGAWAVYHRSLANTDYLVLNTTAASATGATYWNSTTATSTDFSLGTATNVNANGGTYVAYLFAHDAGGFGLTGTDNVISCGSFTTDGSGNATVSLGYEPQWLMLKRSSATSNWAMQDTMRGWTASSPTGDMTLYADLANAENAQTVDYWSPTSTGFTTTGAMGSGTYIYIAIRRGPMKTPTSGTSVFSPFVGSDTSSITTNFPVDMLLDNKRAGNSNNTVNGSRLVGEYALRTASTAAETAGLVGADCWQSNVSYLPNALGTGVVSYAFQRAPGFFDVVCYTGNGTSARSVSHNLTVAPEFMLVKRRSATGDWQGWVTGQPANSYFNGINTSGISTFSDIFGTPTASNFVVGANGDVNLSGETYVAYLFASCPGVSKVGSYTGNGTTQTINCGFTGGARFVLIKRTDSTGDWYVYDTARGMTTLTDPYLLLNSTAAESATLGSVTTVTTGFAVNASILAAINTNAASYIYLAIS